MPEDKDKLLLKLKEAYRKDFNACKSAFTHKKFFLNQDILDEWGIRYNIVSQEKGEYVVVFPDTFHQGFNDGFNVAEAVNFAPMEWIRHGFIEYQRFIAEGCQIKCGDGRNFCGKKLSQIVINIIESMCTVNSCIFN